MSYLMVHVVRANKRTRSRSNELYLTSYLCSSMYVRNHEPRMSYVVRRTRYYMRRSLRPTSSLFSFFERDFFCPCYVLPRTTCTVHDFVRTCSSKNCFLNKSNRSVVVVVFLPGQREPSGTTCAPHYVVRVRRVVRVNC